MDNLSVFLGSLVGLGELVTQVVVLSLQTFSLFLKILDIAVLGFEFLLKTTNLTNAACFGDTCGILTAGLLVTFEKLDAVLKTENFDNHDVGTIEDQGEKQGEAAKVHVSLRVELAGLDFHPLSSEGGSSAIDCQWQFGFLFYLN